MDPFGTSTAYVGGSEEIDPSPGIHNGKYFGLLTEPFCGTFSVSNDDDCTNGENHGECATTFTTIFRTMDVDPVFPLPFIDDFIIDEFPTVGVPLMGQLLADGGTGNFIFSIVDGALPDGVVLNPDGTFEGTPEVADEFTFMVQVAEDPEDPIFINPEGCAEAPPCAPIALEFEVTVTVLAGVSTTSSTSSSSTSTTITTTTTSSSSTSTLICPFPSDVCGQPLNPGSGSPVATDCLYILRSAVALERCCLCPCDVDSGGSVVATDALVCLRKAVAQPGVILTCNACG